MQRLWVLIHRLLVVGVVKHPENELPPERVGPSLDPALTFLLALEYVTHCIDAWMQMCLFQRDRAWELT